MQFANARLQHGRESESGPLNLNAPGRMSRVKACPLTRTANTASQSSLSVPPIYFMLGRRKLDSDANTVHRVLVSLIG